MKNYHSTYTLEEETRILVALTREYIDNHESSTNAEKVETLMAIRNSCGELVRRYAE